jgi:hypothetical protein
VLLFIMLVVWDLVRLIIFVVAFGVFSMSCHFWFIDFCMPVYVCSPVFMCYECGHGKAFCIVVSFCIRILFFMCNVYACVSKTIHNTEVVKHHSETGKYNRSSIYQMKCLGCSLKYIEQTRRTFNMRYKEQVQANGNKYINSAYSNHVLT